MKEKTTCDLIGELPDEAQKLIETLVKHLSDYQQDDKEDRQVKGKRTEHSTASNQRKG